MIAQRNLHKVEVFSLLIMGSDGHVYLLRRMRGSTHVTMAELAKWAEKRIWSVEDVPTRNESLVRSLNETYERYIACKAQELELSADQYLTTADALAGRLTDLVDRGYDVPKAVMVYINKRAPQTSSVRSRG